MKNNEVIKNITFCSLITSINIIFVLLNIFMPFFTLFLIIIIPFSITLTCIKCGVKYSLLTIISSLLITSLIDFNTALIYVFPSLISGFLFAIFIKLKFHRFYIVLFSSLIGIISQFISIKIIELISNIDIIQFLNNIFHFDSNQLELYSFTILFFISLIQSLFSYIIIDAESNKFNIIIHKKDDIFYYILLQTTLITIISVIIYNINKSIYFLLSSISFISALYLIYLLFKQHNKMIKIISISMYILSYFICLIFSSFFKKYGFDLLINVFLLTSCINGVIFIIYVCLIKKEKITFLIFENNETYDVGE